jgi:hypothetical protein
MLSEPVVLLKITPPQWKFHIDLPLALGAPPDEIV